MSTALRCEKCGSDDVAVTYHKLGCSRPKCNCAPECGYNAHTKEHDEHLHYHCRTCRYDWTGPILPVAPPSQDEIGPTHEVRWSDGLAEFVVWDYPGEQRGWIPLPLWRAEHHAPVSA